LLLLDFYLNFAHCSLKIKSKINIDFVVNFKINVKSKTNVKKEDEIERKILENLLLLNLIDSGILALN
jgi:hypothetical protein